MGLVWDRDGGRGKKRKREETYGEVAGIISRSEHSFILGNKIHFVVFVDGWIYLSGDCVMRRTGKCG